MEERETEGKRDGGDRGERGEEKKGYLSEIIVLVRRVAPDEEVALYLMYVYSPSSIVFSESPSSKSISVQR
jgi:hypothetical protein